MILTQIEIDEIKREVRYDADTGHFYYTNDRFIARRFIKPMAVPQPLKKAHSAGDRADKVYGGQFVGVYVLSKAHNAAAIAILLTTGHWPDRIKYVDGNWHNLRPDNLIGMTRSQQAADAANARYAEHVRELPPHVYALSSGEFIGKRGRQKTRSYKTVREVLSAMDRDRWLSL